MAVLTEYQFELDGYVFGLGCPVAITEDGFDPGSAQWVTQDAQNPISDAMSFGRDYLGGATWAWEAFVDGTDIKTALTTLAPFAMAWRNDAKRQQPGAFQTLRYHLDGRTRQVFGRSRNMATTPGNLLMSGMLPVTADFQTLDHLHYGDVLQSATVPITKASNGGLKAPLRDPLTTLQAPGPRQGQADVGGDMPTPFMVTIKGPVLAPWVSSAGWRFDFPIMLLADQTLVIDTHSWVSAVTRNGAPLGGALSARSTRISAARLLPGSQELLFGGADGTGTASCTVKWRSAWASL